MREYVGILLTLLLLNIKDGGSLEKRIPHIGKILSFSIYYIYIYNMI